MRKPGLRVHKYSKWQSLDSNSDWPDFKILYLLLPNSRLTAAWSSGSLLDVMQGRGVVCLEVLEGKGIATAFVLGPKVSPEQNVSTIPHPCLLSFLSLQAQSFAEPWDVLPRATAASSGPALASCSLLPLYFQYLIFF